jgi:hypothetical protein
LTVAVSGLVSIWGALSKVFHAFGSVNWDIHALASVGGGNMFMLASLFWRNVRV